MKGVKIFPQTNNNHAPKKLTRHLDKYKISKLSTKNSRLVIIKRLLEPLAACYAPGATEQIE